ncbi:MAG: hypothetical protein AAB889_02135 [Patescibacteria group bacterium]|mgnify:FL=1
MANKLEKVYRDLTGINPKWLEPKPTTQYIQKAIGAARAVGGGGDGGVRETLFQASVPPVYFLKDVVKTPEGPFTVIGIIVNGVTEYAIRFDVGLGDEEAQNVGPLISQNDWFTLDQAAL